MVCELGPWFLKTNKNTKVVGRTHVDFFEVFVLNVSEWIQEVLLHVVLHGIFHLGQLSVGLAGFNQRLTFRNTNEPF